MISEPPPKSVGPPVIIFPLLDHPPFMSMLQMSSPRRERGHLWAWFILMAEEGVESFKDFSFMRDLIGEVGVIISIKVPLHSKLPLHLSAYTPTTLMTMSSLFTSHRLS
ncbi:hypothetical protein MTR_3g074440 [Medicago truncatula]|uniref:Uncharacterized protein n=1 Tax=Medicago truncatula TaxID=3880 RepID=A0A072V0P1_MEDTR|nr:hypothetical protein MTR_3g074440 [Medicago truncatula]